MPRISSWVWAWIMALIIVWAIVFLAWTNLARAQGQVGPPNQILCNKVATFTGTGAAATVITGVSGQGINLCGWHITNTAATGSFLISSGTTATCATNNVPVTPALSVTSTAPSGDHPSLAFFSAAAAANICVNATLTSVTGVLYYSQF